jgi:hypothetical protein
VRFTEILLQTARTIVILTVCAGASSPAVAGPNLVPNGDLKAVDGNGAPIGWIPSGTGSTLAEDPPAVGKVLKMTGEEKATVGWRSDDVVLSETRDYRMRWRWRCEASAGRPAALLRWFDDRGTIIRSDLIRPKGASFPWTPEERSLKAPDGAVKMNVTFKLDPGSLGELMVAEVVLTDAE